MKVILSIRIANELIMRGFNIVKIKPSNRYKGKAAFFFDKTPELMKVLSEIEAEYGIKL